MTDRTTRIKTSTDDLVVLHAALSAYKQQGPGALEAWDTITALQERLLRGLRRIEAMRGCA